MPIAQSDFKGLPSSGIVPAVPLPASAFCVGFDFIYTGTVDASNPNQSFTARVVIHVENESGQVKYVLRIEEKYLLIIFQLAPGLAFYTWNWQPNAERIEGFALSPPTANVPPGWSPPQIEGARKMAQLGNGASFGVDPAEGSGTTDSEAIVESTFYSGLYEEPLEVGDRFRVRFHDVGAGYVVSRASLLLATQVTTDKPQVLHDERIGFSYYFYFESGALRCARWRRRERLLLGLAPAGGWPAIYSNPLRAFHAWRSGATLFVALDTGPGLRVATSTDEGATWEQGGVMLTNVQLLAAASSTGGTTLHLYLKATATEVDNTKPEADLIRQGDIVRTTLRLNSDGSFAAGKKTRIAGANLPDTGISGLLRIENTLVLVAQDANQIRLFESTDELASFAEASIP